jgi:predicted flap endonuclease-1-like 5' DNA nuclease
MNARAEILESRVRELERTLGEVRATNAEQLGRIAELDRQLGEARGQLIDPTELDSREARIAALQADLNAARERIVTLESTPQPLISAPAAAGDDAPLRWRLRYSESRIRYLEEQLAARPAAPQQVAMPGADTGEHELNRLRWQVRYFTSRCRYLETRLEETPVEAAAPPPPPAPMPIAAPTAEDEENERSRWRRRYLEARVVYLESKLQEAMPAAQTPAAVDVAPYEARIAALEAERAELAAQAEVRAAELARLAAERQPLAAHAQALEAQLAQARAGLQMIDPLRARLSDLETQLAQARATAAAAPTDSPELGQLRWRVRYLDARVAHLETALAAAESAPQAPAPPPAPAPQPAVSPTRAPAPVVPTDGDEPLVPRGAEVRPMALAAPRNGAPDDLRMIAGVGPRVETTLNSLGIYHFDQISTWTPANIAWVDQYLRFRGRIVRERWVEQAHALARGEETEGKRLYLEGDHV